MKNQYAEEMQLNLKAFDFNQIVDPYIHYATENTRINYYRLLGIQVNQFNLQELLAFIGTCIQKKEQAIISSQNLHSIYLFHRNRFIKDLQHISVKRIDGMSIVYCAKLLGYPLKRDNRITWVDLIRPLMQKAANKNWKIFYLGTDEATVSKGVKVLRTDYNKLNIVYANGFFNAKKNSADNDAVITKINGYEPDILIVGMGMPRQEKWILENKDALNATVIMTSGAAIEYLGGKVTIPPRWLGQAGFEWLYRLIENPKRFGFRYMIEPWFVLWLFLKDFGKKTYPEKRFIIMAQYNAVEKHIAKILESQPLLRDAIRSSYKRLAYFKNKKTYTLQFNENYTLTDVAAHVGLENYDGFFFGYYDKSPWSEDGNKYIAHTLIANKCYVTVCDLVQKNYCHITDTKAWNYQQGCMTQWMNEEGIIYNVYNNKTLGAILYNINTKEEKFIPYPVQVFNKKRQEYLSINYRRLSWLRPDYGYFEESDNFSAKQDYSKDGIWLIDAATSNVDLIIKISDLIKLTPSEFQNSNHKVNHLCYSPSYERFVFLHRWIDRRGKYSRLYCCSRDGKNLKLLLDYRMISHYSWINEEELIVWARTPEHGDAYIILNATTGDYYKSDDGALSKYGDGHPTINSAHDYIITDTYPDKSRLRTLLLYNLLNKQKTELGKFFAPWVFDAEKRCDLHPRFKPNSNDISIDSAHEGMRKNYILKAK